MTDDITVYYAELDQENYVLRVICVNKNFCLNENGVFDETLGSEWCKNNLNGVRWIQTSYTGEFRKNYAGIGDYYDEEKNAFITPKLYDNWIFDEETCKWIPPIPKPNSGKYVWDQELTKWVNLLE